LSLSKPPDRAYHLIILNPRIANFKAGVLKPKIFAETEAYTQLDGLNEGQNQFA